MRRIKLYQNLLGLAHNPFPDHAIAGPDQDMAFDPSVHPDLPERMARVFLGADRSTAPKVNFLWSLGSGDEARGYGKSAYMRWMARAINEDLGASVLRMAGAAPKPDKAVAAYASFSTVDVLSLSGVLYGATHDFIRLNRDLILTLRRQAAGAGTDIYSEAQEIAALGLGETDPYLLRELSLGTPADWEQVFAYYRTWHRQRYGRRVFGALTAFMRAVGISRVLVMIDQLEDFTGFWLSGKHFRDFSRLAEICAEDQLFSDVLQVVLAQHPRAQIIVEACWVSSKLGPLPDVSDGRRCIVIPGLDAGGMLSLVRRYLDQAREDSEGDLSPFTEEAVERVRILSKGRPGSAIANFHILIEAALDEGRRTINADFVDGVFG